MIQPAIERGEVGPSVDVEPAVRVMDTWSHAILTHILNEGGKSKDMMKWVRSPRTETVERPLLFNGRNAAQRKPRVAEIRQGGEKARQVRRERFVDSPAIPCKPDRRLADVRPFPKLEQAGESLMRSAMSQRNRSARADHRILKLARTIADLEGARPSNRGVWQRRCKTDLGS